MKIGDKKIGERIPEQLWKEAVSLVDSYGVSQVTRTLRLGGRDLNQRRKMIQANRTAQPSGGETSFVEIDPGGLDQTPQPQASAVWMELERPDGLRLRIRPTGGADMFSDAFFSAPKPSHYETGASRVRLRPTHPGARSSLRCGTRVPGAAS